MSGGGGEGGRPSSRSRTKAPRGTGGPPGTAGRAEVEAVVRKAREKNYGFRTLVHEVVQSNLFQTK